MWRACQLANPLFRRQTLYHFHLQLRHGLYRADPMDRCALWAYPWRCPEIRSPYYVITCSISFLWLLFYSKASRATRHTQRPAGLWRRPVQTTGASTSGRRQVPGDPHYGNNRSPSADALPKAMAANEKTIMAVLLCAFTQRTGNISRWTADSLLDIGRFGRRLTLKAV